MHAKEIDGEGRTMGGSRWEGEKACMNTHKHAAVRRTSKTSRAQGKKEEYGAEKSCEGGKEGREEERKREQRLTV